MSTRPRVAAAVALAIVLGSSGVGPPATVVAAAESDWRTATAAWRAQQERELREPDGWLAVVGLFFLKVGVNTVGAGPQCDVLLPAGAPADAGRIILENGVVRFEPARGVAAALNAQPITPSSGTAVLRLASAADKRPADRVTIGRVALHLHRSGERLAIRLRDPDSALRTQFTALRWFPIDERWRVTARFVPHQTPRAVTIQNILGDVLSVTSPGEAVLTLEGAPIRLLAFEEDGKLWFVLRDATAATDTYTVRFLHADQPDAQGRVLLDFNRAHNPPCAYNPNTTCPLPVAQNRLRIAITAGEKRYAGHPGDRAR